MRIILPILFLFSNYAAALDLCLFEVLLHENNHRFYVRNSNEIVSLKILEGVGAMPFISIKSYSNKMTLKQLALIDEVIDYSYFDNDELSICIDSCRFYEIKGTKFVESDSFGDASLNFVVEGEGRIHVLNVIYNESEYSFYDYYMNFDCGSGSEDAFFEVVKDILGR